MLDSKTYRVYEKSRYHAIGIQVKSTLYVSNNSVWYFVGLNKIACFIVYKKALKVSNLKIIFLKNYVKHNSFQNSIFLYPLLL